MLRTQAGCNVAPGLSPGFAFPWTWKSVATQILWDRLPSSPWHPGTASLNTRIQTPNSQLSTRFPAALAFPISGWATRGWGRRWKEPGYRPHSPRSGASEQRRLRSRKVTHGGARTSADAGEASQGGFRPCECVHGRLCVSAFLYLCIQVRGCLGGCIRGNIPGVPPETGTPGGFLM